MTFQLNLQSSTLKAQDVTKEADQSMGDELWKYVFQTPYQIFRKSHSFVFSAVRYHEWGLYGGRGRLLSVHLGDGRHCESYEKSFSYSCQEFWTKL